MARSPGTASDRRLTAAHPGRYPPLGRRAVPSLCGPLVATVVAVGSAVTLARAQARPDPWAASERQIARAFDSVASAAEARGDASSLARALSYRQASVARWLAVSDSEHAVASLLRVGVARRALGFPDSAMIAFHTVLSLTRAASVQRSVATAMVHIGELFRDVRQTDSALAYFSQALPIERAADDTDATAALLGRIGATFHDAERRDSALVYLREALPMASAVGDRRLEADMANAVGSVFAETEHPDSANLYLRRALALRRAMRDRFGEAETLNNVGLLFVLTARPDSALAYLRPALTLRHTIADARGEVATLGWIGRVFGDAGRPDSAVLYFRQGLARARAGHEREQEATMLHSVGAALAAGGLLDSAVAYHRAELILRRATADRAGEAVALNSVGHLLNDLGHPDTALAYYHQSFELSRDARDQSGEAASLTDMGSVFTGTDQPDSALAYYEQAMRLARVAGDRGAEATVLENLATVLNRIGRYDSVLVYYDRALSLARAIQARGLEANTLLDLGNVSAPDSAVRYYGQALAVYRAAGDRVGENTVLATLGSLFLETGRTDSALVYFGRALTRDHEAGRHAAEAATLSNIGAAFDASGHPDSALVYLHRALLLARAVDDRSGQVAILSIMAGAFRHVGRPDSALVVLDAAAALRATVRRRAGSDANAVAFAASDYGRIFHRWPAAWLATRSSAPHAGASAVNSDARAVAGALGAAERGRAQALRDLLASTVSGSQVTGSSEAVAHVAAGVFASDTLSGGDLPAEVVRELASLRSRHAAALYYFVADDTLTTWLLAADGGLTLAGRSAVGRDSLASLVATLRTGLGADAARGAMARTDRGEPVEQEPTRAARQRRGVPVTRDTLPARAALLALAQVLLPPTLSQAVPAGRELLIVPDAFLGLVPFAALPLLGPEGAGGKHAAIPLGAQYPLRYSPSLRMASVAEGRRTGWLSYGAVTSRAATPDSSNSPSVLVVGDPAMPWVSGSSGVRVRLRSLPGARDEAAAVAARFRSAGVPVELLLGTAATETAVRSMLPRVRVAHLATHGLAYGTEARVRSSYIALAPDSIHDGLLTLDALLSAVPPLRADLVVLSACQTGLGQLAGAEGTVGFQRALLARGARSVLVSLWSVDDEATSALLTHFYAHWLGPNGRPARSKAAALQAAEEDVRGDRAHPAWRNPRFWAAFQLVGAP